MNYDEEDCTQAREMDPAELLRTPPANCIRASPMTLDSVRGEAEASVRARACGGRSSREAVLLVEGPTEREAMPLYALGVGVDFDALGISVVSGSRPKTNLDALWHLYRGAWNPMLCNVRQRPPRRSQKDKDWNSVLTRMLDLEEDVMARC